MTNSTPVAAGANVRISPTVSFVFLDIDHRSLELPPPGSDPASASSPHPVSLSHNLFKGLSIAPAAGVSLVLVDVHWSLPFLISLNDKGVPSRVLRIHGDEIPADRWRLDPDTAYWLFWADATTTEALWKELVAELKPIWVTPPSTKQGGMDLASASTARFRAWRDRSDLGWYKLTTGLDPYQAKLVPSSDPDGAPVLECTGLVMDSYWSSPECAGPDGLGEEEADAASLMELLAAQAGISRLAIHAMVPRARVESLAKRAASKKPLAPTERYVLLRRPAIDTMWCALVLAREVRRHAYNSHATSMLLTQNDYFARAFSSSQGIPEFDEGIKTHLRCMRIRSMPSTQDKGAKLLELVDRQRTWVHQAAKVTEQRLKEGLLPVSELKSVGELVRHLASVRIDALGDASDPVKRINATRGAAIVDNQAMVDTQKSFKERHWIAFADSPIRAELRKVIDYDKLAQKDASAFHYIELGGSQDRTDLLTRAQNGNELATLCEAYFFSYLEGALVGRVPPVQHAPSMRSIVASVGASDGTRAALAAVGQLTGWAEFSRPAVKLQTEVFLRPRAGFREPGAAKPPRSEYDYLLDMAVQVATELNLPAFASSASGKGNRLAVETHELWPRQEVIDFCTRLKQSVENRSWLGDWGPHLKTMADGFATVLEARNLAMVEHVLGAGQGPTAVDRVKRFVGTASAVVAALRPDAVNTPISVMLTVQREVGTLVSSERQIFTRARLIPMIEQGSEKWKSQKAIELFLENNDKELRASLEASATKEAGLRQQHSLGQQAELDALPAQVRGDLSKAVAERQSSWTIAVPKMLSATVEGLMAAAALRDALAGAREKGAFATAFAVVDNSLTLVKSAMSLAQITASWWGARAMVKQVSMGLEEASAGLLKYWSWADGIGKKIQFLDTKVGPWLIVVKGAYDIAVSVLDPASPLNVAHATDNAELVWSERIGIGLTALSAGSAAVGLATGAAIVGWPAVAIAVVGMSGGYFTARLKDSHSSAYDAAAKRLIAAFNHEYFIDRQAGRWTSRELRAVHRFVAGLQKLDPHVGRSPS